MSASPKEWRRRAAMWLCLLIFSVRVIGQIEVCLLAPTWLPPFAAWESGLVPYHVLLPTQISLIAWMTVIAVDHGRSSGFFWVTRPGTRRALRAFAAVYGGAMFVRLVVTAVLPPHTLLDRGLIPILAHWDLAAFMVLASCTPNGRTPVEGARSHDRDVLSRASTP
jgi:hypothetical protein